MPTKTTSPSASSRAATVAIISSGVWGGAVSEAVVHPARAALLRLEPRRQPRMLLEVRGPIRDAVHELVEIAAQLAGIAGDPLPRDVEVVVAVVVALRVGGMRTPGLEHHGVDDHPGDERAVRVGADHALVHELFHDHDHAPRRERRFLLDAH